MATKEDIVTLVGLLRAAFPNYSPDKSTTLPALYDLLQDLDGPALLMAAKACISEPGRAFAPSVGELRGKLVDLAKQSAGIPSAWEAWEIVVKTRPTRYYHNCPAGAEIKQQAGHCTDSKGYWLLLRQHESHLEDCQVCGWRVMGAEVPAIVAQVAGQLGWPGTFPNPEEIEIDRAHFIKAYESAVERASEQASQPAAVRAFVTANAGGMIRALAEGMRR